MIIIGNYGVPGTSIFKLIFAFPVFEATLEPKVSTNIFGQPTLRRYWVAVNTHHLGPKKTSPPKKIKKNSPLDL